MRISFNRIECKIQGCPWKSKEFPPIMLNSCQESSVIHVIIAHPELYTRATGKKPPKLDTMQRAILDYWTEIEETEDVV